MLKRKRCEFNDKFKIIITFMFKRRAMIEMRIPRILR